MAKSREDLSSVLHTICDNVYFQPSASIKLSYPCIIYKLEKVDALYADNDPYRLYDKYSITYITRDPDDKNIHHIATLRMCRFERSYPSDNLHHYAYSIYY